MNPIAQTFFVQSAQYPNGMFLESVDLCFRTKSSTLPVTIQIRPTDNGYPSGSVILPFSSVSLLPSLVNVTSTPGFTSTNYTRFTFKMPVYLKPGEYALCVMSNDPDYELYTAVLGQKMINDTRIVSKQPYSGVFFKSSNSTTFTAYQDIDMVFQLNRCVFTPNQTKEVVFSNNQITANLFMDTVYTQAEFVKYGLTSIDWSYKSTSNATGLLSSTYTRLDVNETMRFNDATGRRKIWVSPSGDNGKFQLKGELVTRDPNISPVIDSERASINVIENLINNLSTNETQNYGGDAKTRYISRRVTLADGFDASAITVYISAYKPINTNIKVYVKILSRDDPDTFDNKNWIELPQISSSTLYSTNESDVKEFQFSPSSTSDTISYTSDSNLFDTFGTFAVKIVCLAVAPTVYPVLYDMRAIALPS